MGWQSNGARAALSQPASQPDGWTDGQARVPQESGHTRAWHEFGDGAILAESWRGLQQGLLEGTRAVRRDLGPAAIAPGCRQPGRQTAGQADVQAGREAGNATGWLVGAAATGPYFAHRA